MPTFHRHHRLNIELLGWDIPEIHLLMDRPSQYLGGRHRVVRHNLAMLHLLEAVYGRDGTIIFAMHIFADAGFFDDLPMKGKGRK